MKRSAVWLAWAILLFIIAGCTSEVTCFPGFCRPSGTIASPADGSEVATGSVTAAGEAFGGETGHSEGDDSEEIVVTAVDYRLNNGALVAVYRPGVRLSRVVFEFTASGLRTGENTITVIARNAFGKEGHASVKVRSTSGSEGSFTLTVSTNGNGTVVSEPAGITCGSGGNSCSASYPSGTPVLLTATPVVNFQFWANCGEDNGGADGNVCGIVMDQDRGVFAQFTSTPGE